MEQIIASGALATATMRSFGATPPASRYEVVPLADGRARLSLYDGERVTDIYEGPHRFIANRLLDGLEPGTKLGVRKVRP